MNERYRDRVALLIKILPSVYRTSDFAVHGGTAINLFHKNMPRYSVDIDLIYLPVKDREQSLKDIEMRLLEIKQYIEKSVPDIKIFQKHDALKLFCHKDGIMVKIEVNGTIRGVIGDIEIRSLCPKAKQEFDMTCLARIVPFSQLYGGKIAAALGRQHPRDLFDCRNMEIKTFDEVKNGLMFYLLGSDKPIIESLQPNPVDRREALDNQFKGMSDIPFTYDDFEETRKNLMEKVNEMLNDDDKDFLLSFERGEPDWNRCCLGNASHYPSVRWKLRNILHLKEINPNKYTKGIEKLSSFLY
jgi:predicted nucleotidyltransferase component of viral defense system